MVAVFRFTMFSTFPDGISGLGLALLRVALGSVLTIIAIGCVHERHDLRLLTIAILTLMVVSAALLIAGYRTRVAAVAATVAIVGWMISFSGVPNFDLFDTRTAEAFAVVIATAIVCLGPGAFSLDSRLFGRREIVIPKSSPKD